VRATVSVVLGSLIAGFVLGLTAPAVAAHPKDKEHVLVMFSEGRGLSYVDDNAPGIDQGDLFARENALSFTLGGPVIGVSYSQGEVIAHDPEANSDVRRVFIENLLPKGRIYMMGVSELQRGTVPKPGWVNSYAIIGGTGKYAGARGTMSLVLLPDGKTFKGTARFTLR
jgi:hypothetical protein